MKNIKKKLKPMLPTLREKRRYLAFEIVSKSPIKALQGVKKAIELSMLSFIGIKGAANAGMIILEDKYNPENQRGLIKVGHKYVDELRASLALVKEIDGEPVIVKSVGASGIMKQAEARYIAS